MDYYVSIDNKEHNANADALSITGRVNGVNVAAVLKLSSVKGSLEQQRTVCQRALNDAFNNRAAGAESSPGEKVTL